MPAKNSSLGTTRKRRTSRKAGKEAKTLPKSSDTVLTGEDLVAYLGAGESRLLEHCLSAIEEQPALAVPVDRGSS